MSEVNPEKKYPTEQEIYEQILEEIQQRGFGVLLAYTGLGMIEPDDPSWAEVILVGENYKAFFLHINPKSIPHFDDPATYIDDLVPEDASEKERQQVIKKIRSEHKKAMQTGRFVYVDTQQVGLQEVEEAIREHSPQLYPELMGAELYLVGSDELAMWAEYLSEVEEAIQERYGMGLADFLSDREPLVFD